jgi:drug/metabolite transporter (DMT)-like permease
MTLTALSDRKTSRMAHLRACKAYVALFVGVVSIAWSAIFVRWTQMPGITSAFYRVFIAAVTLWPFLLFVRRERLRIEQSSLWLVTLGGICFAGDLGLYNTAVLRTSAGSATFLGNNSPLLVGLLTWAVTRRFPSTRFWTALGIALAGAWCIVSVDAHHSGARSSADLLAVGASACFALYLIVTERLRQRCGTLTLLTLSTTASAMALLAVAVVTHSSLAISSTSSLAALLGLGLICQLTGYVCLTYALGHLPATATSLIMLAVAPLTAIFALLVFGEAMSLLQSIGGGLVLLGVWIVTSADRKSKTLRARTRVP